MSSIVCVGEMLVDFVCENVGVKLSEGDNFIKKAGGAPANVSAAIAKLGGSSIFVGKVGNDSFGRFLYDTLSKLGVDTRYCLFDKEYATTLAFVSLDENRERDFEFIRGADERLNISEIDLDDFKESTIIHLGSATALLGGSLYETYLGFIAYCKTNDKVISFDPNYRQDLYNGKKDIFIKRSKEIIRVADIVKVSLEEGVLITGIEEVDGIVSEIHRMGAKVVIVTLGKKGSVLSIDNKKRIIPSIEVNMIDATGAGDAYVGAVLYLLAATDNVKDTLNNIEKMSEIISLANKVGAKTTEKYGAIEAIPYLEEVQS